MNNNKIDKESFIQENNEKRLPFESEFYNLKNDHSITAKDEYDYSNKEPQKNKVRMTEFKEINSKHKDSNFNIREEQEEFNILKDIKNISPPQTPQETNQQLPKKQKYIFLQIQEIKYLIDYMKSLKKDINEEKTLKNIEYAFKSIDEKIKIIFNSSFNSYSSFDFPTNDKEIIDLQNIKNQLLSEKDFYKNLKNKNIYQDILKEFNNIQNLTSKKLDINCKDDSLSNIIDKEEKQNYEKNEEKNDNKNSQHKVKHDRNDENIFLIKAMRQGLKSLHRYIIKVIGTIDKNIILQSPVIPNEFVKNTSGKEKILNMNIEEIYSLNNKKNKRKIEELLSRDIEDKDDELQLLIFIFNLKYKKIIHRFINDQSYIKIMINDQKYKIKLLGFETFTNVFSDYDEKAKEKVKIKASNLIKGEITKRRPRNKKNN